jgi:hypothetical protein
MPSNYGKGNWGVELYSQSTTDDFVGALAPSVAFAASLSPLTGLTGVLAPMVAFGPSPLTTPQNIAGGLAPSVTFSASLSAIYAVAAGLAPQTALGATLTGDWAMAGNMPVSLDFAADAYLGPLWAASAPCPPSAWTPSQPCPPPMWTPEPPPQWQPQDFPGSWGLSQYGVGPYNLQSDDPWYEAELCDGG